LKPLFIAAAFIAAALGAAVSANAPEHHAEAAPGLSVEFFVRQFDEDYPDGMPSDPDTFADTVYIKTHDGLDWMSKWDTSPNAINGLEAVRRAVDYYHSIGKRAIAWFVPMGTDYAAQLSIAEAVLDTGVDGLYADVEPYESFCFMDCPALAENFWKPLRAERPNAHLGVIYEARPWWWDAAGVSSWMSVADVALPMCYWEGFVDQPPWNDPRGCVQQAWSDLQVIAPGHSLEYVPILQGDSTGDRVAAAVQAAQEVGSTRVSVWRRGVIAPDVWNTLAGAMAAAATAPPISTPEPTPAPTLSPSASPSPTPSPTPTPKPTPDPAITPTPTVTPTAVPTDRPNSPTRTQWRPVLRLLPTEKPTMTPTTAPSGYEATPSPSRGRSARPSVPTSTATPRPSVPTRTATPRPSLSQSRSGADSMQGWAWYW